jgi:thioesterase domain-containing protein
MIIRLRNGDESAPLFLFPGAGADARELSGLAASIDSPRAMLGMDFSTFSARDNKPLTVTSIADACACEIRTVQQGGPYCLVGYSFGGLVAVEVARLLQKAGQKIGLLAIIDTLPDHRNWPRSLFFLSQARRACWHLQRIGRLSARDAIGEFKLRLRGLRLRLRARRGSLASSGTPSCTAFTNSPQDRCLAAMKCYVPAYYPGKIIIFSAEDEDFGCDPAYLWRRFADRIEQRMIPGSHVGIVRNHNSISSLASALDACLRNA